MDDKIDLSYFVSKYNVFEALEDYIDEFLSILRDITSTDYNTEGGIDNDNIR